MEIFLFVKNLLKLMYNIKISTMFTNYNDLRICKSVYLYNL